MTAVLWHIELSHYNEKARWALDYKAVPHVRRQPPVGTSGPVALALTRGKSRRTPVLRLDGRTISDSTAIIAALEEHRPQPPLYPEDPELRRRALDLEDFFDEQLAPYTRRFFFSQALPDSRAMVGALVPSAPGWQKQTFARTVPLVRPVLRRDFAITEETARAARDKVVAAMDRVEAELGPDGYLVGDRFSVADLTAAAVFTPVLSPPQRQYAPQDVAAGVLELREELEARPGGAWVAEMYARHRGTSAEV